MSAKVGEGTAAAPTQAEEAVRLRFSALEAALMTTQDGAPRPEAERGPLIDAVRAALDRLADPSSASGPDPGSPVEGASLTTGTILANSYTVREYLARGGMAEIYRVRHRDLHADFAVKILQPEHAVDPLILALFKAEARALTSLRDEAIVGGHALLRHADGRPFLVLDLLRGPSLAERLRQGPLTIPEVEHLGRRLAGALATVHAAEYVHGDVSAENVVLPGGAAGAVLIDFGTVRRAGERVPDIAFAGKSSIAAPEQLAGRALSPAADLYALGLLLLTAARGERPAQERGALDEAIAAIARKAGGLAGAIRLLLDPHPGRRPTANGLIARLATSTAPYPVRWLAGLRSR